MYRDGTRWEVGTISAGGEAGNSGRRGESGVEGWVEEVFRELGARAVSREDKNGA